MWLTMEKRLGFIMKFSKKLGNLSILSNFYIFYCFFRVILVKRCALVNFQTKSQIWWNIVVLSKNYAILIAKPHFITKWNMLSLQNMIIFHLPLILSKNEIFHFISENLWVTVASLASMQSPKTTGFDKRRLSFMAFLNNLLDS